MVKLNCKAFLKLDIILVFLFFIIPMVDYLNLLFRGVKTTWPIFLVWFCFILFNNKNLDDFYKVLFKRFCNIGLLILFIWVVTLYYFFRDTNAKSLQYTTVYINFLFIFIIDSYYSIKPVINRYVIIYLCILALGIQAVISIPYILSSTIPITRAYSAGLLSAEKTLEAMKNGIGDNALYTSSSIIIFSLLPLLKNTGFSVAKFLIILSSIFIILACFVSTFFTTIFLFILGVFLAYYLKNRSGIEKKLRVVLFTVVFIFSIIIIYNQYVIKSPIFSHQISKIERIFSSGSIIDVTGRIDLLRSSINTFKGNPFFGIGVPDWQSYDKIGEHNTWVDYLGNFGLIGVLPLYLFLLIRVINRIRINYDFIAKKDNLHLFKISIFLFFIGNFISPLISSPNIYIMFLFLYTSIQFNKNQNNINLTGNYMT